MSTPAVLFPDVVELVIDGIRADVVARYADAVVANAVPADRPDRFIVIRRQGGPRRNLVIDSAQLRVESYAPTAAEAHDLAQLARALVHGLAGTVVNDTTIGRVDEFAGPADLPDPVSTLPRYVQTLLVDARGTALT